MKEKDNFDIFIEKELKNSSLRYDKDKFKDQVLSKIPQSRIKYSYRNLIIYSFVILSCIIFALTIKIKNVIPKISETYFSRYGSPFPSFETILYISLFIFVLYIIANLEFKKGIS